VAVPLSRAGGNEAANVCCPKVWSIITRDTRKRESR
jgi:hypothetical protein